MKKINNILNKNNCNDVVDKYQQYTCKDDTTDEHVINWLFDRLKDCLPAYKVNIDDDNHLDGIKREWLASLKSHGVCTDKRLEMGIASLKASGQEFLPSVGKFIEGCSPSAEDLGLPSLEKAFKEASARSHPAYDGKEWSHQGVFHAQQETGAYNLRTLSKDKAYELFKYNYEQVIKMILNGEQLKEIHKPLEKKNYLTVGGVQFELHGYGPANNFINYQVAGGKLKLKEFILECKETIRMNHEKRNITA